MALGTICGHVKSLGSAPGIIWVDAHADINTPETTWSGNLHGQPVSFMLEELKDETIQLAGFDWVQPVIKDSFQTMTDRNTIIHIHMNLIYKTPKRQQILHT